MDIKNLFNGFSASPGKIKIAALAGLVCVVAIILAVVLFDGNQSQKTLAANCGMVGDSCSAYKVGEIFRNCKCGADDKWANITTTTTTQTTTPMPATTNTIAFTNMNCSVPANPASEEALKSSCKGDNMYCNNGTCEAGCAGYFDSKWYFVAPGAETCAKPKADSHPAVYKCVVMKGLGFDGNYTVAKWPSWDPASGKITSQSSWKESYSLEVPDGVDFDGDEKECYNSSCGLNQGSPNCSENKKCETIALAIKNTFNAYLNNKGNIEEAIEQIKSEKTGDEEAAAVKAKKEYYINQYVKQLGVGGYIKEDAAKKLLRTFEQMISKSSGPLYGLKNVKTQLPLITKSITWDDVACLKMSDLRQNSYCPTESGDQFKNYAYTCDDFLGCHMKQWVAKGSADYCENNGIDINVFDIKFRPSNWASSGDGWKLCDKFTLYGGMINGCGYDSIVYPENFDPGSDDKDYVEVYRYPTGRCWDKTDATRACEGGGENSVVPDDEEEKVSVWKCVQETKTFTTSGGGTIQPGDVNSCANISPDPKNAERAACENCVGGGVEPEQIGKNCTANQDCGSAYCIYQNLNDAQGICGTAGCNSPSNGGKNFAKGVIVCGSNKSQQCLNPTTPPSASGWEVTPTGDCYALGTTCDKTTGECLNVNAILGNCEDGTKQCRVGDDAACARDCGQGWVCEDSGSTLKGVFQAEFTGVCRLGDEPDDDQKAKECASTPNVCTSNKQCADECGAGWVCKSGTELSKFKTAGDMGLSCLMNDVKSATKNGTRICVQGDKLEQAKEEQEAEKAGEGEKCKTDKDCQEGLVCENGECMTKEEAEEEEEQEEANNTAPKVTISSPKGEVTEKTAELEVSTDIEAECKYMDSAEGSFSASNFDGNGMSMGGSGTSHSATLSNLTDGEAKNCKYPHAITVLCKNAKASASGSQASKAIGSAKTTFTVDLSKNEEFAPTVESAMDSGKIDVADPVLKVITNQAAECQYKEGACFKFGGGKKFETTGQYNHNTQLSGLTKKQYTFCVVCRDKETCAEGEVEIELDVDPAGSAPNIVSTTPEIQAVANPTLSVTTDRPAACQFMKDNKFTYGDGGAVKFGNDSDYTHSHGLPAAQYPDGTYKFYVACKDNASGAAKTMEDPISTTLQRGGVAGAPVIYNTTAAAQATNSPTLSVITKDANGALLSANCQYKEGADFDYGAGTPFGATGGSGHSVTLSNVADGTHTYYVVCQNPATNVANKPGTQIMITVSAGNQTCADLSSNDKQNDDERDYDNGGDDDSKYLWRSVEDGTRGSFTKVDWHAGYQFTPNKDGYATQLCGYFESGEENKVSLYNGSYKEIASAQVEGEDGWNCVNISAVEVKADKRYYVVARVDNGPINYEYQSGLLPQDANNATIEAGVRQLANEKFGEEMKKYDYMIFGLVDVRINFTGENEDGPEVTDVGPAGSDEESDTVLTAQTDIDATCKFGRDDVEYSEMEYAFGQTGGKTHSQKVCDLDDGKFTWYARCKGATGTNDASTLIQFEVND